MSYVNETGKPRWIAGFRLPKIVVVGVVYIFFSTSGIFVMFDTWLIGNIELGRRSMTLICTIRHDCLLRNSAYFGMQ